MTLSKALDMGEAVADLGLLVAAQRSLGRKVGIVGYCLGGRLAFLAWLRLPIDAAVSYYGVGLGADLDEVRPQRAPLLLHIGGTDPLCLPEARHRIPSALGGAENVHTEIYPDQGHAFARRGGDTYDGVAAAMADTRTAALLLSALGSANSRGG